MEQGRSADQGVQTNQNISCDDGRQGSHQHQQLCDKASLSEYKDLLHATK
ncbi:hypothetical protein SDC9_125681 [bioreactor metagenome]|uniref:Uncharacterized protein n=1 Tax=bioreactor metagenome TaxID=1076179 RepID=A0A645CNN3_9ZZZZ